MRHIYFAGFTALLLASDAISDGQMPPSKGGEVRPQTEEPLAFRAEGSNILVYVESDRRHLAAVDINGKLLWHKDVTQEVRIKSLRDRPARVNHVGKPLDWMLKLIPGGGSAADYFGIALSTKEFGLINSRTGKYKAMGSD